MFEYIHKKNLKREKNYLEGQILVKPYEFEGWKSGGGSPALGDFTIFLSKITH